MPPPHPLWRTTLGSLAALLVTAAVLYYVLRVLQPFPVSTTLALEIVSVVVVGYAFVAFVARQIRVLLSRTIEARHASTASIAFRFFGYVAIAVAVLVLLGPSGEAILAGGTFAGLVLGLAGTTVLSNVFGGVLLLTARPFRIGDRVTVTTWQYGLVLPAYPPKFYSDDRLTVGYTGVVADLTLTYTILTLDEGPTIKIPNNVMVQAAVIMHPAVRWVRVRYEVPGGLDPERVLAAIQGAVHRNPWVTEPERVRVLVQAITPTSIVVTIDALCKSAYEDPPRSSLLIEAARAVETLRGKAS